MNMIDYLEGKHMNKKVSKKMKMTLLTAIGATLIIPGAVSLSMKAEAKPELAM
ncbi:hypothetical protein SAMN04488602_1481, partial [Paenibacillus sp. cl123]